MRLVLKNSGEVYHYFANRVQPSGRAGNTSYALPRAYSYAACIGKHIAPGIVALSSGSWSVTTSRHQSDLRYACSHLDCVFVPDVDSAAQSYQAVNLSVDALMRKASTAKSKKDYYIGRALHQIDQFNRFAEIVGSDLRIARPVTDATELKKIAVAVKAEAAKRNAAIKERERIDALSLTETLALWRDCKPCNSYELRRLPVALRIRDDQIETSRGASVPLTQAASIWAMVGRVMSGNKDFDPGHPIGVYRLTGIRNDGSMVVGCHDIPFSELQGVAVQLGFTS